MKDTSNSPNSSKAMPTQVVYHTIDQNHHDQRLDNFLIGYFKSAPKSLIYKIIRKGEVRVNKKRAKPMTKLRLGDIVRIPPVRVSASPEGEKVNVSASMKSLLIESIHADTEQWLVINKPSGLAVHGGSGIQLGLIEALRKIIGNDKLELVHRIDKDTSGCLLIAKTRTTLVNLHQQLREHKMRKKYLVVLEGIWHGPRQRVISKPLLKYTLDNGERRVTVSDQGKPASTMFQLIEQYPGACLVAAYPKTGRTHQIRVHAQAMKMPIVGDEKYNSSSQYRIKRLMLHAQALTFSIEEQSHHMVCEPGDDWQLGIKIVSGNSSEAP